MCHSSVLFIHRSRNYYWRCSGRTHIVAPNGYSLLVVGVPQCHSRGDCSGEHCANCIHLPRLSGCPASQFFGEASRAFPQHGWRSAYSLRETLSPTQDQGQHTSSNILDLWMSPERVAPLLVRWKRRLAGLL